jgi:hypothetical protein
MAVWIEPSPTLGEVRVEIGTGLITELVHEAGKRNAQLKIKAMHTDLRDPVTGWVDTADSGVWDIAQLAKTEAFEIEYRIEVHRKAGVDVTKPLKELGNREKVRDVARLARKGEMSQIDREPPANVTPADEPPADADTKEPSPPPAAAPERQPRVREEQPWVLRNSDNNLNLGSWSYEAAVEFVGLAHRLIGEHNATEDPPPEIRIGQVKALADSLLIAADRAQAKTRIDGHIDRQSISHRRARQAIRSAVHTHPVPWGADADARAQWADELVDHAAQVLGVAYDLFRYHEIGDPR